MQNYYSDRLLGWVFSELPIPGEEIVRLNVMAAFFCAAAVLVFFHVVHSVLTLVAKRSETERSKKKDNVSLALIVASAGASLLLAFSETYWSQAVSVEVYSLHVLFLSIVLLMFLKVNFLGTLILDDERNATVAPAKWWTLFAFTVGLAFTNHMTTILLAPGFLFLYFAVQGFSATSWRRAGAMSIPFTIGLSAYLYLPIRAAHSPLMNWGEPSTLERFLWHIGGKQYRVWIFSSTEAAGQQLKYFVDSLPMEFAYVGVVIGLIGLVGLWRGSRKLFIATILLFLTCVFYSINYDIHDIDSYFLLAYFCVVLWSGCGLFVVLSWLNSRLRWNKVNAFFIICISLLPLFVHYGRSDESKNYLVEDYTMNMFASLEPNALIFSFQWDYWVSASYYYQLVKGVRPDVAVVDKELLRRSWYLKELEHRYPWLIQESKTEVEAFLRELYKFEHNLPYEPNIIEARFVGMISSFIHKSLDSRSVYVTSEIEAEFTQGLQRVPQGLALRLLPDNEFHPTTMPPLKFRPFARSGRLEDMIRKLYADSFVMRGVYYYRAGNSNEAERAFREALNYDSANPDPKNWLRAIHR